MIGSGYEQGLGGDAIGVFRAVFERQKAFGEHAFGQLDDERFFAVVAPGLNSVAVIARHMGGNMLSRWMDFLDSDGEKPTRDREAELAPFPEVMDAAQRTGARGGVMETWDAGWAALFGTLDALGPEHLDRTVKIRGKPHSVLAAMTRQLDHYAFHVGQINVIARQLVGTGAWKWFTLAPGGTAAFNEKLMGG